MKAMATKPALLQKLRFSATELVSKFETGKKKLGRPAFIASVDAGFHKDNR